MKKSIVSSAGTASTLFVTQSQTVKHSGVHAINIISFIKPQL